MKTKYSIFKLSLLSFIFGITACHKDTQSYIYKDINNLTIVETTATMRYSISVNDSLIIVPNLQESMPEGDPIVHQWLMGDSVISTEKELRIVVDQPVGNHTIWYSAKIERTGVEAHHQYTLIALGTYHSGYFVAHNRNGKAEFSFIRADDVVFENPFEEANKKTYTGQAMNVSFSPSSPFTLYGTGTVLLWTTDNVWTFDGDLFKEMHDVSTWLPDFSDFPLKKKGHIFLSITNQSLIFEGRIYGRAASSTGAFSALYNEDYDLYPFTFPLRYIQGTFFYDNKKKRFLMMAGSRSVNVAAQTNTTDLPASFDMSNVGLTMVGSDGTSVQGNTEYYYIMADGNDRYILQNYSTFFLGQGATSVGIKQKMINSPDIEIANVFSVSATKKHLYYAANNKIYLYDIIANSSRMVYAFPAGRVVKSIKRSLDDPLRPTEGIDPYIAVAVNSESEGEVYYFHLLSNGSFVGDTYTKKFGGFGDIVGFTFR